MAELDNLIDSRISLISHQDVRYDGTLFSINTSESSIVLKDVKCLGTEGRVTDESKKVGSSNAVIPFVTFPGSEIKDLYVHEGADAAPPAPAAKKQENRPNNNRPVNNNNNAAPPRPPSNQGGQRPQQQQQQQQQGQQRQYNNNNQNYNQNNNNNNRRGPQNNNNNNQFNQSKPQQQQQTQQQQAPREPREPRPQSNAGTGAHLLHMKERKSSDAATSSAAGGAVNEGVFDFEAGLSVFKKEEVLAKVATEDEKAANKYKKDDFFDLLSTDRSSREEGVNTRLTASQERSLNQDTFGAIALQGNGGYRRNYGGRGGNNYNNNNNGGGRGGGRGRGGGGGRGYYRNNNSTTN